MTGLSFYNFLFFPQHVGRCPAPLSKNKPDNITECEYSGTEGTKVCQLGECTGSICHKFGLEECFLVARSVYRN